MTTTTSSEPFSKKGTCKNCRRPISGILHRHLGKNGAERFVWVCPFCNQRGCFGDPLWIPNEKVIGFLAPEKIEALPIIMPEAINRCVKCGARQASLHHWAPKAIFGKDEAETWPQDYLCDECHIKWHTLVTPQLVGGAK